MATTQRTLAPPATATPPELRDPRARQDPHGQPATHDPRDPLGLRSRARRGALILTALSILLVLSLLLCVGIGPVPLSPATTVQIISDHLGLPVTGGAAAPAADAIVWSVRVPRVLMGAAVGA